MIKKTMIRLFVFVFILSSLFLITSCAAKKDVIGEEARIAAEREQERARQEASRIAEQERQRQQQRAEEERQRQEELRLAEEKARQLKEQVENENIYFAFDRSDLTPEARNILTKKSEWLKANTGYNVVIEGHCDERGSAEYNLALGERRAESAANFMRSLGVSGNRMKIVSYGKERPAVPGSNEAAWARNRRAEFRIER